MNQQAIQRKTPLLFLCHRIPYPPNKGDKIRSFHLLHHLSQHFDIFLGTFVDDPADWPWVHEVEKFCLDCSFVGLRKWPARLKSLTALLTGKAMSIPFYASTQMQRWVRATLRENDIRHAVVYSSSMAQYLLDGVHDFDRKVVDFVDVDSDKWQQYAAKQYWPMSWLYRREARKLLAYECHLSREFDAGFFVSSSEAQLFRKLSPATADKVGFYNNGVNTEYFYPSLEYANPYPKGIQPIVFTGAMDYWPNVDAVFWFATEVVPQLRATRSDIYFYVVGSNPAASVVRLAKEAGVVVTGRVEDIRPYLQFAIAAVAPMRVARGVQNKVLEAMAMSKTVLVSRKGLEGIEAIDGEHLLLAESSDDYCGLLTEVLNGHHAELGDRARVFVKENFNWDNNLPEVTLLLGEGSAESVTDGLVLHV
jgi:sugar transferase (PEP-CTERM/EpsH1 system associated)